MNNSYSGSIEVERILKSNLPTRDSGDKWYFVVDNVNSTKGELWCTNSSGLPVQIGNAAGLEEALNQINDLSNASTSIQLFSGNISSGSVTLSDSVRNYKKLLIQCGNVGSGTYTSYLYSAFTPTGTIPFSENCPITYADYGGWNSLTYNGTDYNILVITGTLKYPIRKIQGYK